MSNQLDLFSMVVSTGRLSFLVWVIPLGKPIDMTCVLYHHPISSSSVSVYT